MNIEEFKKLSSDEKLNVLFELFTNHLKHHEVLKKDFKKITNNGIINASIIATIITLLGVTIGITILIFNLRSLLGM